LLKVEGIAGIASEIADAIDEEVVASSEAAERQVIATRPPLPSPAWRLMPDTFRRASRKLVAP